MNPRRHITAAALGALLLLNGVAAQAIAFRAWDAGSPAGAATAQVAAQVAGAAAAAPSGATPQSTRDLLQTVAAPPRNEANLARLYKGSCADPAALPVPLYREEREGETRPIWVLDEPNRRFFQVQSTLLYASEHLLFYVQDGSPVSRDSLAASANVFETKTFPMLQQYFGTLAEQPRITIFNGRVPGVGGYFSGSDMLPQSVNPYSNERPMVFMSLDAARPGSPGYDAILAHEIQHFIHAQVHPQQDSWLNEGASELAMAIAGYEQTSYSRAYLNNPETQLDGWAEHPGQSTPYYGGGYTFLEYFAERMGGYEAIKDLIASPGTSIATVESYLKRTHPTLRFDDLFRDFVVANYVNDRSLADGRYGYQRLSLHAKSQETLTTYPVVSASAVRPYATRYIELAPPAGAKGTLDLRFGGSPDARLYGTAPHSGAAQWWGNAADESASTLTREVDLTGVDTATLRFSAYYNTERDYDYAGVAVSTDNGCSWRTLPGRTTTDTNPVGQNLGNGFTGHSDEQPGQQNGWVDEEMDLTPFAGKKALVRFFLVNDQSYHGSGLAVDDISIPEIGFADDAEADTGWQADGFIRSLNAAAVDWAVQAITYGDGGQPLQVLQLPASQAAGGGAVDGTLAVPGFGESVKRVVVAVSPLVPVTLEPVDYRLEANVR